MCDYNPFHEEEKQIQAEACTPQEIWEDFECSDGYIDFVAEGKVSADYFEEFLADHYPDVKNEGQFDKQLWGS